MARRGKKNKRTQGDGIDIHAPSIAMLVLAATAFVLYLWQCGRHEALGNRIEAVQAEYDRLHRRVMTEEMKWEKMMLAGNIRRVLAKHRIVMDWPAEDRIIRIPMSIRRSYGDAESVDAVHFVQVETGALDE
jgi:hypothetical protein